MRIGIDLWDIERHILVIYMTDFSGYNEYKLQYNIQYTGVVILHTLLLIIYVSDSAMVMLHFDLFRSLSQI